MRESHINARDEEKISYYLFIGEHAADGRDTSSAYSWHDSAQQALDSFARLQAEHPDWHMHLGVHRDRAELASVVERFDGMNVLSTIKEDSSWDDSHGEIDLLEQEAISRLQISWQKDWSILGVFALIPLDSLKVESTSLPESGTLCPDNPRDPLTSIREAYLEGKGWVSLEELKEEAYSLGFEKPTYPVLTSLRVSYETDSGESRISDGISPSEYKAMRERYLAQQPTSISYDDREFRLSFDCPSGDGRTKKVMLNVDTCIGNDNLHIYLEEYDKDLKSWSRLGKITVNDAPMPFLFATVDTKGPLGENIVSFLEETGLAEKIETHAETSQTGYPVMKFDIDMLMAADPFGLGRHLEIKGFDDYEVDRMKDRAMDTLDDLKREARERMGRKNVNRPAELKTTRSYDLGL